MNTQQSQESQHLCTVNTHSNLSPDKLPSRRKEDGWTSVLVLAAVSTTIGSAVPFGYHIGVINTPADLIKSWCNETLDSSTVTPAQLELLWSSVVSMLLVGGMIGSFAGSWCADYAGRKGALVISDILGALSAVMFFVCKPMSSVSTLLAARFIAGLSSGLTLSVMPMYLMELAPSKVRGAVAVLTTVGVTFGVLLGQFMGLDWILGSAELWHWLLSCYLLPVVVSGLALPFIPESPKYLYSVKADKQLALKELARLRGCSVDGVFSELESMGVVEAKPWTMKCLLSTPGMGLPLALVCSLQAGQQLSGINAVCFYSTIIFKEAGLSQTGSQYATLGVGVINFGIAVVMTMVLNYCRRRPLILLSCFLIIATLLLLVISIIFRPQFSWMGHISVFCILTYVLVYGMGLGPIPYFIGSELFDVGPRPVAMALGSAANWTANLIVGLSFPTLHRTLGPYSFIIFISFTVTLTAFLHFKLPETFNHQKPISARETEKREEKTRLANQGHAI